MFISEKKKDFKITKITRDTDGHSIVRKGTLHQEDITYALREQKNIRNNYYRTKGRN